MKNDRPWKTYDPVTEYEDWHRWMIKRMENHDDKIEFNRCTTLLKAQLYSACVGCYESGKLLGILSVKTEKGNA